MQSNMTTRSSPVDRIILIVMDSCGCGASPDAGDYGDMGSNTLSNVSRAVGGVALPHLAELGLAKVTPILGTNEPSSITGAYGRMREQSKGKDTTTGHFEMVGLVTETPFPTFPQGFPPELLRELEKETGRTYIGNCAASGTNIITELGARHMQTGELILYTSADSVLQIAAHEQVVSLPDLYEIGQKARRLCDRYGIARVIVRPFIGHPGSFVRTYNRKDFSIKPPGKTSLDAIVEHGLPVLGIGKIWDIFAGQGVTENIHTEGNQDGMHHILQSMKRISAGLIFCNLVDFDVLYGHRRDPKGYADALTKLDAFIPQLRQALGERDLVILTADHGNDPTFAGTDHTREDVPLLAFTKHAPVHHLLDMGTRHGFYDIAQTLCEAFALPSWPRGTSFLHHVI